MGDRWDIPPRGQAAAGFSDFGGEAGPQGFGQTLQAPGVGSSKSQTEPRSLVRVVVCILQASAGVCVAVAVDGALLGDDGG